ncbi:P27 family phage terminase small subunit [Paludisphaera soli]|uniref:P27 family phage terminase small subunit n=1 Tax=Paludisphaera soli TaxID=2712865 RepID=UPI0013ECD6A8|nr:P27 family phage terminase small subunit [Paludisphaera soli]
MDEVTGQGVEDERKRVKAWLVARGERVDVAEAYASAFVEYREAAANVNANGSIVQHPRTGNPITNPYIPIRDAALQRALALNVRADELWS